MTFPTTVLESLNTLVATPSHSPADIALLSGPTITGPIKLTPATQPVITSDIDAILAQRGTRYGTFTGHAKIAQGLKEFMRDQKNWQILSDDMKESLEMIAHKIGRILNGDPNYDDSWIDIGGYSKLIVDRLTAGTKA